MSQLTLAGGATPPGASPRPAPRRDLADAVGPGWAEALEPVRARLGALGDFLRAEQAAARAFLPAPSRILAAFRQPLEQVRVLIVGQDPYPTPGHPMGLSFSVAPHVRPLPGSLRNIFREYRDDLGLPEPANGDLSPWAERGVMLLNRVLTVGAGAPGSHRGRGWEEITECAIRALAARDRPLVAVLWGRDARACRSMLGGAPTVESPHPSPLSAGYGFFGSRPFSGVNTLLTDLGAEPVDWRLP